MASELIESLLIDLDTKLEKHTEKKDEDPRGKKTLKYGLTKEGYNATMKYLKANKMVNNPDFPKELKKAYSEYNMHKAYHVKGGELQRELTDLYKNGKQNQDAVKYISTKFLESLEERFNKNSDKTFNNLDDHEKKGLLSLAFNRPTSLMSNKLLMDAIKLKNQEIIAHEMLNYEYKEDEYKVGLQKRALMGVGYVFGYEINKDIDTFLENNLKADPNFYSNQMLCYKTVDEYRKCLQDANVLIPEKNRSDKFVPAQLKKTKDFKKPYTNRNVPDEGFFDKLATDMENKFNEFKEGFKSGIKKMFPKPMTPKGEDDVNRNQDNNLQ